jgi:hypothetical protein
VPSPPPEIKAEPDYETAETDTATMLDDVSMTSRTPTWKSEMSPSLSQTEPPKGSTWGSDISETGSGRKVSSESRKICVGSFSVSKALDIVSAASDRQCAA